MIKPNWDVFKAKFSDNPQDEFEYLCYLLFCKEYKKENGVFTYVNQPCIETNPVTVGNEVIGFQAKFYTTTLRSHKVTLLTTIQAAKDKYSTLTTLIIFSNQDWGTDNKPNDLDPDAKKELEHEATKLGIKLEWRTAFYFKAKPAFLDDSLFEYFFTTNHSIISVIKAKLKHNQAFLDTIHRHITFREHPINIKRPDTLRLLNNISTGLVIVYGSGGVGKTSIIKELHQNKATKEPFYILNATAFNVQDIDNIFSHLDSRKFLEFHQDEPKKTLVIDSLENLILLENPYVLQAFLAELNKDKWKVILTVRQQSLRQLLQLIPGDIPTQKIEISRLGTDELNRHAQELELKLPINKRVLDLIKTPFYLNEYCKLDSDNDNLTYKNFKKNIWNKITHNDSFIEQFLMNIAMKRAQDGGYYIDITESQHEGKQLLADGILGYVQEGYFITHDIYEEWALVNKINSMFKRSHTSKKFLDQLGDEVSILRAFRIWFADQLADSESDAYDLLDDILRDKNNDVNKWQDEILIAILKSDYSHILFKNTYKNELLKSDGQFFTKITSLLITHCQYFDNSKEPNQTQPMGSAWENLIKFMDKYFDKFSNYNLLIPIIYKWNSSYSVGESTRLSGLIALKIYQTTQYDQSLLKQVLLTILNSYTENKTALDSIFETIIKEKYKQPDDLYYDLSRYILDKNLELLPFVNQNPNFILDLYDLFWSCEAKSIKDYTCITISECFGIDSRMNQMYVRSSANQTWLPILFSFQKPDLNKKVLEFILTFVNKAIENYARVGSKPLHKVTLNLEQPYEQYIDEDSIFTLKSFSDLSLNNHLWSMYRIGDGILPSLHMILENYLLAQGKILSYQELTNLLLHILKSTISSSITAVVTSIVLAYPDKTFHIAKILFTTKDFIFSDWKRRKIENMLESKYAVCQDQYTQTELNERRDTSNQIYRKTSLWNIFLQYKNTDIIDINQAQYLRDLWIEEKHRKDQTNDFSILFELKKAFQKNSSTDYICEKFSIKTIINSVKNLQKYWKKDHVATTDFFYSAIAYICSGLLVHHRNKLTTYQKKFCHDNIIKVAQLVCNPKYIYMPMDGVTVSITTLAKLFHKSSQDQKLLKILLLWTLHHNFWLEKNPVTADSMIPPDEMISLKLIQKFWIQNFKIAENLLLWYITLQPKYDQCIKIKGDNESTKEYELLYQKFKADLTFSCDFENINILSIRAIIVVFQILPENLKRHHHKTILKIVIKNFFQKLNDDLDYIPTQIFFTKLANTLLTSNKYDIKQYVEITLANMSLSRYTYLLLADIILVASKRNAHKNFWYIWELFQDKIYEIGKQKSIEKRHNNFIKSYLFFYNLKATDDLSFNLLTDNHKDFFTNIANELYNNDAVLESFSKLLSDNRTTYSKAGLTWIANMLTQRKERSKSIITLTSNSIKYLEIFIDTYIKNDQNTEQNYIKTNPKTKRKVLIILDILIINGSSQASSLKDNIT